MPKKPDEAATPPDDATTVIVNPPANQGAQENAAALAQVASRMEAIENRITEGLEGERQWTTETITSLQSELANLREQVQSLTADNLSLTQSQQTIRDELIQQLREAREKLEAAQPPELVIPLEAPPPAPPDNQPPNPEGAEGHPDQPKKKKQGKRVI